MQWPIAENNPHNPRNIFAKRVCKLGKHCRNYKGKCHSVSKVLTATLKSAPKLYAVVVKLRQLMIEKNRLKKSLWFMFHAYRADFLTDQLLKKSKFFIAKMKKKNFRFEKN